jgi:Flp pilus assembly protein TadG
MQRRNDPRRAGQAIVEMAVVLSVLLIIVFAIFDLGRGFMVYLSVNMAATLGVEYGTQIDSAGSRKIGSNNYPGDAQVVQKVWDNLGPSVDPTGVTTIQVDGASSIDGKANLQVSVSYALPLITPVLSFAFPQGILRFTSRAGRLFPE